MSDPHRPKRTRRAVLRAGAGVAGGALAGLGVAQPNRAITSARTGEKSESFEAPGYPSRAAHRALAAVERRVAKRSDSFERVVDAVAYLDLDAGQPVNAALEVADADGRLDGTLLEFPPGVYRLSDGFSVSPAGAFGIVGPRAVFRLDSGLRCEVRIYGLSRGIIEGLTFDQRAGRAAVSVLLRTDGHVDVRELTYRGAAPALGDGQGALLRPVAANREASIRIDGLRATGGTNAGSHHWVSPGPPPPGHVNGGIVGAFVGLAHEGVVQFVEPELRGWENGLYASRTPGAVQVVGGTFVNNNNTAIRLSGAASFCDGATIVLDATRWPQRRPGRFTIGEIQGVSAVRVETGRLEKDGPELRNLDIRAYAMDKCPALVVYRGSAGTGIMTRCRLTTHLDGTPAILLDPPASGFTAPEGAQAVRMDHIEIRGTMTGAPAVRGTDARPNSLLADSCIRLPGAGPDAVVGVRTRNVGFGRNCAASRLAESRFGVPGEVPEVRDSTVRPPAPGPGLPGVGVLVGFGAVVAYVLATLPPAVAERLGNRRRW